MKTAAEGAANLLSVALASFVVAWWLGLEQILPGLVLIAGAWRLVRRHRPSWGLETALFGLLILWSLASMTALDGLSDWLLYLRGEFHLVVAFATYCVARLIDPTTAAFARFLKLVTAFAALLFGLSLLILTGVLPIDFPSPVGLAQPGLSTTSGFINDFVLRRSLATPFGISMVSGVERQSLLFLYQGGLATVLLLLTGWLLTARRRLTGPWRSTASAGVVACLVLVAFTGSRAGVVLLWGAVAALGLWQLIGGLPWRRWVVRGVVAAVLLVGVFAVTPQGDGSQLSDGAPWERMLIDFRVKSFLDRLEVYTQSIERLGERPLTGWGIQGRPGERQRYLRLGTHSEPLNVAFRFGWVGLALWAGGGVAYWRRFLAATKGRGERSALIVVAVALGLTALVRTFQWDLNVLWMVAAFLGTSAAVDRSEAASETADKAPEAFSMLGTKLHPRTIDELHQEMERAMAAPEPVVIGHQNLHGLYLLPREPAMRAFAARADLVFLDGMALVWLARGLGHRVERRHRVTYADWLEPLAAECARRGWRVFHLGGRPGVGERARQALVERHPDFEMETLPGYFEAAEEPRIAAAIADYEPHVLMVGMGMPRQEAWVVANVDKIRSQVILTCGACMDYAAGVVATPPRWAGRFGIEWLFRWLSEPVRLASRYLVEPWSVAWRYLREWWAQAR